MARNISTAGMQAVNASETDAAFLILVTIDHAGFSEPLRVSSDAVDTISRGQTFTAFPFEISLPDDSDDRTPRARLSIDNIDRSIVQAIRSIDTPPSVLIEIVRSADLDTVEAAFPDFKMREIEYNALVVEGALTIEELEAEPYPSRIFSPADFPGLF